MKKLVLISAILLIGTLSISAQTYYYKYLFSVDVDGAKYQDKIWGESTYYTFANNKTIVYRSDEKGNTYYSNGTILKFVYQGTNSGKHMYKLTPGSGEIMYFNSDYSRMNLYHENNSRYYNPVDWKTSTQVYERTNGPEEQKAPTQFY